jgi:hypothetical protein
MEITTKKGESIEKKYHLCITCWQRTGIIKMMVDRG